MQLVDAHCHLGADAFKDCLPQIMEDAKAEGVTYLISAATEPARWARARTIAEAHPGVFYALGVHPWFADRAHLPAIASMDATGAVAVGEIGLDAAIETPDMAVQIEVFEAQLALAREKDLPVVVHCRRAFGDLMRSLKRVGPPPRGGMMHAFSGSAELVAQLAPMGFFFSMGRSLTYRASKKRDAVLASAYPDLLLLETDSPDMPPVGLDKPNVPANLRHVVRGAAALLGVSEEAVAVETTRNACRLFGLRP